LAGRMRRSGSSCRSRMTRHRRSEAATRAKEPAFWRARSATAQRSKSREAVVEIGVMRIESDSISPAG
jgi:ribosomal protein L15E